MSTSRSTCPTAAPPSRCEAKIIVDVAESGGRTVERTTTLPVRAKGAMIGVKKDFDDSLGQGDVADLRGDRRRARRNDARRARRSRWSLYQLSEDYQWFNSDGRWSYEPVKSSKRLAAGIARHRSAGAGEIQRAGRLGPPPPRPQVGRRRSDEHHLRRRLVGDRRPRHARQRRRHARQGELRAGRARPSCASPRISPARRRSRWSATSWRSSSTSTWSKATTSCRSTSAPIGVPAPTQSR